MRKTDVLLLAQLVKTMQEIAEKLDKAFRANDFERFEILKREMLALQRKIDALL